MVFVKSNVDFFLSKGKVRTNREEMRAFGFSPYCELSAGFKR